MITQWLARYPAYRLSDVLAMPLRHFEALASVSNGEGATADDFEEAEARVVQMAELRRRRDERLKGGA